ncbi:MAG: DUF2332 family protein [Paracoccus sp. (in: a-proteobacteria)]
MISPPPLDLTDPLRLRAYIWPDQPRRLAQLDMAMAQAGKICHRLNRPVPMTGCQVNNWLRSYLGSGGNLKAA